MNNKHTFALYMAPRDHRKQGQCIQITALGLGTRITKILRLRTGDKLILFDDTHWYRVTLEVDAGIVGAVEQTAPIAPVRPEVTFLLPILEKAALEAAVYSATVFGVRDIQLVTTTKSRKEIRLSERERLEKIMRAASEQSKQYCMPRLAEPLDSATSVQTLAADRVKLFGDPAGRRLLEILQQYPVSPGASVVLAIGPEGGFTDEELLMLESSAFKPVSLGASILRACDAVGALLAVLRAYY